MAAWKTYMLKKVFSSTRISRLFDEAIGNAAYTASICMFMKDELGKISKETVMT
jgi:hypothetical protein